MFDELDFDMNIILITVALWLFCVAVIWRLTITIEFPLISKIILTLFMLPIIFFITNKIAAG